MTTLKYLMSTGVATSSEIIAFKNAHPKDFDELKDAARIQAKNLGIELEDA